MDTQSIAALIRAHNLPAVVIGTDVVTADVYTLRDEPGDVFSEPKVFRAGCRKAEVLAWLGY